MCCEHWVLSFFLGLSRLNSVYSDNPKFSTKNTQQDVGFQLGHVCINFWFTRGPLKVLVLANVNTGYISIVSIHKKPVTMLLEFYDNYRM